MVGILVSFWDGLFSGAMLVSGSVNIGFPCLNLPNTPCLQNTMPHYLSQPTKAGRKAEPGAWDAARKLSSRGGAWKNPWAFSRRWDQTFFISTPIWGRFPSWRIFFRWVETTNQFWITSSTLLDTPRAISVLKIKPVGRWFISLLGFRAFSGANSLLVSGELPSGFKAHLR